MVSQTVITKNAAETQKLARQFSQRIKNGHIIALYGDLGSGKTTFIKGLAAGLGIKQNIPSPTFILIRQYPLKNRRFFFHIDLYRVSGVELAGLGLDEIMANHNNIVAIEWAEKISHRLPAQRWEIRFKYVNENEREISFSYKNH